MKFRDLFDKNTWLPDWDKIFSIKEFSDMEKCEQSKVWHAEGNVMCHTKLVTEAMQSYLLEKEHIEPSSNEYYIMMMSAAICHDLGKPSTTVFDKDRGDYTTKCHGAVGARITRRLFFDEFVPFRENVCYMVRRHMDLHHIFDKEGTSSDHIICLSHGRVTVKDMLILNVCDSIGSHNGIETKDSIADKEERVKALAESLNCYEKPFEFNNDFEKMSFFRSKGQMSTGGSILPKGYGDFTMYVMIGVPGSGKSYYIENYLKGVVQISRDLIRTEIGLKGEKPQGNKQQENRVTEIFNKRMEECCKNKQDFVIDNTNVRKMYRDLYTDVALKYGAKVVYIYIEAPDLQAYKDRRNGMMPLEVIDRMWSQFDFPEPTEYNEIIIQKQ